MSNEEFQNMVKQRLQGIIQNNGNRRRVKDLNAVNRFILERWEYVPALPNDNAWSKMPF